VRFTAKEAGEPGAWRGLYAHEKGEVVVAHAVLEHGGTEDDGGALSAAAGGSLTVTGAALRGNVVGVRVLEGGKLKSLDATTFERNATAMQIHVDAFGAVGGGNTYAAPQVIELIPGTVEHDATWSAQPGAEIRTENNIAVDKATLTLAAGLELRFDGDARLSLGYYHKGNVRAEGTAEKPVVLRGVRDEAEAWHGVVLHEHADASALTHTLVADTKNVAAIELSNRARVELKNVVVRRSKAGVKWGCDGKANPDGLTIEGGGKAALAPGGC
jgi:hypothetical protein